MSWLFIDPDHVQTVKDPAVIMKEIKSWLFKDPIVTVACLNFENSQSNSKKQHKKIKLS